MSAGLLSLLLLGSLPSLGSAAPPPLSGAVVQSNLAVPWDLDFTPDGRMLVTERAGRVRIYESSLPGAPLVATFTVPDVRAEGESGLMGIAVDIDHATNHYVYVCASRQYGGNPWWNEVLRYTIRSDGSWGDPAILLGGMAAANRHDGCALEMDRSGRLWISMGDVANGWLAQDRNSLNGKILRINRDGSIPADNPVIAGYRNAVYSMGHRNPQGIAIRPGTDQVYAIEHGENTDDEINLIMPGANYGWPCYTGAGNPFSPHVCGGAPASSYTGSLWASGGSTIATSGAAWAVGPSWQDYNGSLFVSTLKESDVRRFASNAAGTAIFAPPQTLFDGSWGRLRAMVQGPGGQLYATTSNGSNDRVVRIAQTTPIALRLAGPDRYATAAAVSADTFGPGASIAYVATGQNFPDALAGSTAAAHVGGPLLLVQGTRLPAATANELARLRPSRIVVLGSEPVISAGVFEALRPYATSGDISRIAGADRYETAARLSNATFGPDRPAVFIATGADFPDAVSASAGAGRLGVPLLLTRPNQLPSSTAAELDRLNPGQIFIVGGPSVVSDGIAAALDAYTNGPVTRLAGADRYATSAAVARAFWSRSAAVYAATGQNYPDALSAGAAAGWRDLPLLLVASNRIAEPVGQEMIRLKPSVTYVIGSSGVVSDGVGTALRRLMGTP